jgi:hypothetical protein
MPQTRDRLDRALAAWFADPKGAHPLLVLALRFLEVDQQDLLFEHLGPGTAAE